jgi:hypothetical protein
MTETRVFTFEVNELERAWLFYLMGTAATSLKKEAEPQILAIVNRLRSKPLPEAQPFQLKDLAELLETVGQELLDRATELRRKK